MKDHSREARQAIEKVFLDSGGPLPGGLDRLVLFAGELMLWNERFRMSGFRDAGDIAESGVYACSRVAPYLEEGESVVDVGSGNGFPGLVLAALLPGVTLTLVEKSRRKTSFLKTAAGRMGAENVRVLAVTAEDLAGCETFDSAISMAVFRPSKWLEVGRKLIGGKGKLFLLHSGRSSLPEKPAGLKLASNEEFLLPWSRRRRGIAVYSIEPQSSYMS